MCGRFRLSRADQLAKKFGIDEFDEIPARYNVAPTQDVMAVRQRPDRPGRYASILRWGLIPYWAKDPTIGGKLINARAESAAEKPAFKEALIRRRCIVPCDGFYEWKKEGKQRRPFCITVDDGSLFGMAGLWERWKAPDGKLIESCTILTTAPNAVVADLHDRMPAILPEDAYELWLDPGFGNIAGLSDLLRPFDPKRMAKYEVSSRVNRVENDDPSCAEAVVSPLSLF
jgi:putative SOS response-associated peptidase YedK